jgi:hypothetical protein
MRTFFRHLAAIVVWPRKTMREILDGPRDRATIPLVLLAMCSGAISNVNERVAGSLSSLTPKVWLIVIGVLIANAIVFTLLFYAFAWLAFIAGRFLEGTGQRAEVRTALAWGLAPLVWALLVRIPAAIWGPAHGMGKMHFGDKGVRIDPAQLSGGCFIALGFAAFELALLAWYLVVASRALAEAHRFSAWRGFGTLVMVAATPIIVVIAAVLSMH